MSAEDLTEAFGRIEAAPVTLTEAFLRLAEIVRVHLGEYEAQQDYIAFGPEPSDRVRQLIDEVKGE